MGGIRRDAGRRRVKRSLVAMAGDYALFSFFYNRIIEAVDGQHNALRRLGYVVTVTLDDC